MSQLVRDKVGIHRSQVIARLNNSNIFLEFLNGVIRHPPVYPSYTTPIYSNIAYNILGLAYENITGRTYNQGLIDLYQGKLGMSSTTPKPPGSDANAFIPYNDSFALFSYDSGLYTP